jgi:hypothetical protein
MNHWKNPPYGMMKGFTPRQAPLVMSALPSKLETAMVISPPMMEQINSIPNLAATSRTNELANFVPPFQIVTYSTPPIPHRGTGVPHGLVLDYYFN